MGLKFLGWLFNKTQGTRTPLASETIKIGDIKPPNYVGGFEKPSLTNRPYKPVAEKKKNSPLIQIELDTYGSVPKVFHNGEEITDKVSIDFSWVTNDEWGQYGPYIKIVHCDNKSEYPLQRTIEYEDVSND
ncbi:hypothetical protein AB1L05_09010 [Cytobacillus horneckiae]|uniref:hypothetical protein n=1 Tax=Cytobacillus horneckiae TaxID=549687 RepID=UPI0039A2CE80